MSFLDTLQDPGVWLHFCAKDLRLFLLPDTLELPKITFLPWGCLLIAWIPAPNLQTPSLFSPGLIQRPVKPASARALAPSLSCMLCSVAQSYLTLCDPLVSSPPGFSVRGILQARILEWVAMPFSRGSSWPRDQTHFSCVSCTAGRFFAAKQRGSPLLSPPGD